MAADRVRMAGGGGVVAAQLQTDAPNTVRLVLHLTDAVLVMEIY